MERAMRSGLTMLLAGVVLAGCGSLEITTPPLQVIEEITFHPSLDVDLSAMTKLESGIYVEDLVVGEGDMAGSERTVDVRFEGYIATTGRLFVVDQAAVILGVGEIPAGLDLAIQGMREGGERRAVVPPELGYGQLSRNGVPGGSVLVYEIRLFEVL